MLKRKALHSFEAWKEFKTKQALLVTGARQVGKTYLVREFAKNNYDHVVEINLFENEDARAAFSSASNSKDLFLRISAYANHPLIPHKTLIFIDEVQESKEVVTKIKFLLEREEFDYILSGSMLGVELKNIRSAPVGYLATTEMFPLDFEEFCWANGIGEEVFAEVRRCFAESQPVDDFIHKSLSDLFHRYLIVGGMPDAVQAFLESDNIQRVRFLQKDIAQQYRADIAKYAGTSGRAIKRIYDVMPGQLSQQSKRFVVKDIEGHARISRYENDFLWLADANVALPVYNVKEPRYPLQLSMSATQFKLFFSDVGLLTYACGMDVVRDILSDRPDINFGAIYENVVAQELRAHGFKGYYFKNRKLGELDFVIEWPSGQVLPIEVKSGKDYRRHRALDNVLSTPNYGITKALVLYEGNVAVEGPVLYCPTYMVACLLPPAPEMTASL